MASKIWKLELLFMAFLLCMAEVGFVGSWAVTPVRVLTVLALIGAALALPRLSHYLEGMRWGVFWMGAFGLFAISRLGWLAAVPTVQISDFSYYFQAACEIAKGRGITDPSLSLFPNWWGYPIVLGSVFRVFGCSAIVGKLFSFVLAIATVPALYLLGRRFGGTAVGRWTVLLFILWPVQLMYSSVLATEHLALPLAVTGFLFGVKLLYDGENHMRRTAVLCGVFLAAGGAVRPAVTVLVVAICWVLVLRLRPWRRAIKAGGALLLSYVVVTGLYSLVFQYFNHGNRPTPGFSTAANLLYGSNSESVGMWNEQDFSIIKSWQPDTALENAIHITRERFASYSGSQIFSLFWKKNTEFWGLPYYGFLFSTHDLSRPPTLPFLTSVAADQSAYLFQLFLVILCTLAAVKLRATPLPAIEAAAGVIILGTAMHLVFVVSSRYSYQYIPMLLICAAAGLARATPGQSGLMEGRKEPGGCRRSELSEFAAGDVLASAVVPPPDDLKPVSRSGAVGAIDAEPKYAYEPDPAFRHFPDEPSETDCRGKRIGILIVTYNAVTTLSRVLKRIPPSVWRNVEEVVIFDDASQDATFELGVGIRSVMDIPKLTVIKHSKNLGYGGNQKAGYQYFIAKGMDVCVLLHGDGQYAPELLARMYAPLVRDQADAVFGSRMMKDYGGPLKGGMPLYKYLGNQILTGYENRMLGMNLTEFHSGYRAYNLKALAQIDCSQMTNDFHFDTEIIIKLHHQQYRIREVPIPTYYGGEICYVNGLRYAAHVYRAVRRYCRTIRSVERCAEFAEYFVNYPLKHSRHSSHDYAIRLVGKAKDVLDVGCGNGFLARALAENQNRITGIDNIDKPREAEVLDQYFCADLDEGIETVVPRLHGKKFDVVLLLDVLEHLRNPDRLLGQCSRLVKPGGQIVVSVPNIANITVRVMIMVGQFSYRDRGILDRTHLRWYTRETVRQLLAQCKLLSMQEIVTVMPLDVAVGLSTERGVMRCIAWVLTVCTRAMPGLLGYQIMHVAVPESEAL